jgi:peptidyl-prolyl cis-trans isomerase SurA
MKNFVTRFAGISLTGAAALFVLVPGAKAQSKPASAGNGKVVEEIIARVNNEIITLSDYQHADTQLHEEVQQDCQNCPQDKLSAMYAEREKNLLRDQIDQSLLEQRAKDLGISVEADVIKKLDQVRQQNNLGSMEDLEKAVEGQGLSWEEYKTGLRNSLLTQEVIRREVGARVDIGHDDVKKFYDEHKDSFVRPEMVVLSEIFISTEGKTPDEVEALKNKANSVEAKLKAGADFEELARRNSDGPTSKDGGMLGGFERGQLSKQLEDQVFPMKKGEFSEVTQTKTGFEIIRVDNHFESGLQPMEKVENEIMNKLYMEKMQPVLRNYLAELREQSYVVIKPGYTDTAAVNTNTGIKETTPTPDAADKKLSKKAKKAAVSQ